MSSFLSRNLVPVACVAGSLFVGYCIYFDKKRRSHPDYKKNLFEKRRQQAEAREAAKNQYPDLGDAKAVQAFLLDNMTKGDEAFGIGKLFHIHFVCLHLLFRKTQLLINQFLF